MQPTILDFNASQEAILKFPYSYKFSFLEKFGMSPISAIKKDIAVADSPERAEFLHRYIAAYKSTFKQLPPYYLPIDNVTSEFIEIEAKGEIHLYNVKLCHTSAWYLFNRVPIEIEAIKRHLLEIEAKYVALENIETLFKSIKSARSVTESVINVQHALGLSKSKAKCLVNVRLSELTALTRASLDAEKEDFKLRLKFLKKLV